MTSLPGSGENLAHAVEVVTAWRSRAMLTDEQIAMVVSGASQDAGNPLALVIALADLADALLQGIELVGTSLLSNSDLLTGALTAIEDGEPWPPSRVGLDAVQVLDRVGRLVASFRD